MIADGEMAGEKNVVDHTKMRAVTVDGDAHITAS
jgi:hypothetical protein